MGKMAEFKMIMESYGIHMKDSIYANLSMLSRSPERHTHVAFLLDKHHNVLSYKPNVYFKTKTFPYSQHAEIAAIINYYSKKVIRPTNNNNKILIVIKLKTKTLGSSKPCKYCAAFILNNWDNLKLKQVIYSNIQGELNILEKNDLINGDFCLPSSVRARK